MSNRKQGPHGQFGADWQQRPNRAQPRLTSAPSWVTYQINQGIYGGAWPLVRSRAFRIIGTGPMGPTYPIYTKLNRNRSGREGPRRIPVGSRSHREHDAVQTGAGRQGRSHGLPALGHRECAAHHRGVSTWELHAAAVVGYYAFLNAVPTDAAAVALEAALRKQLAAPAATESWALNQSPSPASVETAVAVKLKDNQPAIADTVTMKLPPGMNTLGFAADSPVVAAPEGARLPALTSRAYPAGPAANSPPATESPSVSRWAAWGACGLPA